MAEEHEFPTILELRDRLSVLIEAGLGSLPIQIVIAPDSSIQAIAKVEGQQPGDEPAIMIEFPVDGRAFGISFITTDRLTSGRGMPTLRPM